MSPRLAATALTVLALLAGACAAVHNTPAQDLAAERWRRCEARFPLARLDRIELDGRIWFWYVVLKDRADVRDCLQQLPPGEPALPEPVSLVTPRGG